MRLVIVPFAVLALALATPARAQQFDGPATEVAPQCLSAGGTIQRDTTGGAFRLVQKFTENRKEFELNDTLTNISAGTINDVVLMRFAHFGVDNDIGDDRGDRSPRSGWMADVERLGPTAHTVKAAAGATWREATRIKR